MLEFLYRRIIYNKWLFICLLVGALSASGIVSAIPIYSKAVMQKVLTKDLEIMHAETGVSPGKYSVILSGDGLYNPYMIENIKIVEEIAQEKLVNSYQLPVVEKISMMRFDRLYLNRDGDEHFNNQKFQAYLTSISNLSDHVAFVWGTMPAEGSENGVYEAAVSLQAMKKMRLMQGQIYSLEMLNVLEGERTEVLRFKITGVFSVNDKNELFWSDGRFDSIQDSIIFNAGSMENIAKSSKAIKLKENENTWFFDYYKIKIDDVLKILDIYAQQQRWKSQTDRLLYIQFPVEKSLIGYIERQKELRITLWILTVPLMVIICFYTLIISKLIMQNDKNEIAVLKSRGARRTQIFLLYMAECSFISVISTILGPNIGILICNIIGSSNGFLEFVGRKALPVSVSIIAYLYAFLASAIFSFFVLIPAHKASAVSIVQYKKSMLEQNKPFWKAFYLDFVFLGLSIYGLYVFRSRQQILSSTGLSGVEFEIDPLIYFTSTFFIIGASLIFLRIYPIIIYIIFTLGEKRWKPVLYFSLVNSGKSDANLQAIMLFIILSLSFGIINANQARTLNSNMIDRVMYKNGADIVIEPYNNLKHIFAGPVFANLDIQDKAVASGSQISYQEPNYNEYAEISGIESITKVFSEQKSSFNRGNEWVKDVSIMGIIPHEFGKTAWSRSDLLPRHINEYLNIMTRAPKAVFLSESIRKEYDVKNGDDIVINLGQYKLNCTVYGFINSFPGINPRDESGKMRHFLVMNLKYINEKLPSQPYEIWIKKQDGIPDGDFNTALAEKKLKVERVDYSMQEIIKKKNDPIVLGTNGTLTMCFLTTMLIMAMGFVIFWMLSIRERTLKFGIFRAIGMRMRDVTLIMLCEQILVSGVAILVGFILGSVASKIYIPLLEISYSAYQQTPPFRIVAYSGDYIKVLGMIFAVLVCSLALLYKIVRNINVHQVLKLGED